MIMAHPILVCIEPFHERKYITSNSGQEAAKQEDLADMRITLEAV
jgi:hypothetical protein